MKSKQPNKNTALRESKAIKLDLNHALFELGNINANVHLLHKQKGDLLLKIERLSKEAPAPDAKTAESPEIKNEV
jgi:hypothetical protein